MPRDTQRERVYRAERAAAREVDGAFWTQTIPNADLQRWVDDVLSRKAIQSRWGRRYIDVGLKRGGRALAHGSSRSSGSAPRIFRSSSSKSASPGGTDGNVCGACVRR